MTTAVTVTSQFSDALAECLGHAVHAISRERSRYSTSHPIDNVDVRFVDGSTHRFVCKDLAPESLLPAARRVMPAFVRHRLREPGVYTEILRTAGLGTATCFGVLQEGGVPRWLLLERVDGVELFQVGDIERWQSAARWAAGLHRRFADHIPELRRTAVPLLRHDEHWVDRWARRTTWRLARVDDPRLRRIAALAPRLTHRYAALPRTFVHGELYASNVIVGPPDAPRVCPVDWEMAAIAPGLVDLAALTAGGWSADDRQSIELAYCDALGRRHDETFVEELDVCRLAACVQWLGWAPGWRPPPQHSHEWLDEATVLADRLAW